MKNQTLPHFTHNQPRRAWLMLFLASLLLPVQSYAASLKPETVAAWNSYVQTVGAAMQDRTRPGSSFLWTFEDHERIAKVHNGEIVVAPAPGPSPRKVPGGLIHHWVGAAFLPNVKLNDILEITEDYDRYKDFYQPAVIASRVVARNASDEKFSMLLMNKAFFTKSALDADYQVTNVHLDDHRFYSVTRTTRVQEIDDYSQPNEHRIPEGEGAGYIWKLFSVVRMEQHDGGVYVEVEAVALSREIPGAVRFMVDPIARRVSRNSILTSIKQTADAVHSNLLAAMKSSGSLAKADHTGSSSSPVEIKNSAFVPVP